MKFTTQLIFLLATVFALGLALGVVGIKSMTATENFENQTYCYKCGQDKDCTCDKSGNKSGRKSEDEDSDESGEYVVDRAGNTFWPRNEGAFIEFL